MKRLLNFVYDHHEGVCTGVLATVAFIGIGAILFASFGLIGGM